MYYYDDDGTGISNITYTGCEQKHNTDTCYEQHQQHQHQEEITTIYNLDQIHQQTKRTDILSFKKEDGACDIMNYCI